ncbi:MAG: ABC1 kinase family protein [Nanoarchaeota archaeon]
MNLLVYFKDLGRFEEIMNVLIEEDFGHLMVDAKLITSLSWFDKLLLRFSKDHASSPERMVRTFERLGPTFIKFGQILSVRPDLLPAEYIRALERLQHDVSPVPFPDIKAVIEEDLGKPLEKVFKDVDPHPLASASIAQVHRARLKNGKQIVLKVQRPHIEETFAQDIHVMSNIAALLERHRKDLRKYKLSKLVREFEGWVNHELNFSHEIENIRSFHALYKGHPFLHIPKVYAKHCSQRVIAMEYFDGVPINMYAAQKSGKKIHSKKDDPRQIRKVFSRAFQIALEQVFVYGRFHADPHPGNILIRSDGDMALVDFGIICSFNEDLKQKTLRMFYAVLINSPDELADILLEMSETPDKVDYATLKKKISIAIADIQVGDISKINVGHLFETMLHVALDNGVRIPREFVLFAKSIVTIEGIALAYDPHFNLVENSKPFIEKLIRKHIESQLNVKKLKTKMLDAGKTIMDLPRQTSRILRKLEEGSINLNIQDTDIKKLAIEIDRSSNRVAYATIIAAFVISGALLMGIKDFSLNVTSTLSFTLFGLAGLLGATLFYSIQREG